MQNTRKDWIYFILGGFFISNTILAELTGGKLFSIGPIHLGIFQLKEVILSVGLIPWPIVFITTDLINEYFGRKGVQRLTFLTIGLIIYCFLILYLENLIPIWDKSPIRSDAFSQVFIQSMWTIFGSVTAFAVSQLVDVIVFTSFKKRTGKKKLWLRATGSTAISQVIDTFLVGFIAFVLPGFLAFKDFILLALGSYFYKLLIAVFITPVIYLIHAIIDRYLSNEKDTQVNMK